ncbi:family 13 glycoside hydrolase [Cryphonectria parasitica EP155]|uniref:Family 13 glycoside hydrolase n=1 Tax=Cryphonectria parasitica (strain ATCC 38755 / EP155) TaxID=660469 RepID=A0A9P5CNM6_CRYP1|nr:family 13 glycoside hydrolase [Cryphonectria parasitica EP155]KAF3765303.1 family 13 glycoside hydrolase [Cryphonectria parasitica EP155]
MTVGDKPWWKSAVVYQIYPASFKDSNSDGVGDLQGIISKLDYIASLGVNVIWICPMYDSPQVDMGYDISNYEDVYGPYGTLADMEQLIRECHDRGLRIMLDLVINHSSSEHMWFKESRSSKSNPKRDWYIWRPAKYDDQGRRQPPNNWRSNFGGGSVWEWDPATEEYYLHLFAIEQPDLNWENPETRRAIYESSMEFWLKRGVDGFRIDTVNMYSKPPDLADAPVLDPSVLYQAASTLYCNGPRMHEFLDEMSEILRRYGAITVGELPCTPETERVLRYVSAREGQLNMVFQFDIVDVGMGPIHKYDVVPRSWQLPDLKRAVDRTQALIRDTDGWSTVFMENHDQARSISRFGNDAPEHRVASGKLLAMLQSTLSGTMYVYQGQEIGQVNPSLESYPITQYKDIDSLLFLEHLPKTDGGAVQPERFNKAVAALQHLARDHARIPMVWDGTKPHGGFSDGKETWMAAHPLAKEINVTDQLGSKSSVLAYWRSMLAFRREYADLFVHGRFDLLDVEDTELFTYVKTSARRERALVVLNFTASYKPWKVPAGNILGLDGEGEPILSMIASTAEAKNRFDDFAPYEGRVYLMKT